MILLALNVLTLSISIALFLLVTIILVALLLFVKNKLTPSGEVEININEGEKTLKTEMGNSLLSTLGNNQIFLPSACGGGGSCGMCKCQVLEGGGSILPTETGFFSRKQQQNNWRLACQVKVKDNLKIQIPEEILGIKKWECEVVSNHNVASFIKEFVVKLPEGEQLKF
ncbi:MAG: 2Fe-2S iron-sulfur cluster-binding protein, partial [Bacteroidales bacterium]